VGADAVRRPVEHRLDLEAKGIEVFWPTLIWDLGQVHAVRVELDGRHSICCGLTSKGRLTRPLWRLGYVHHCRSRCCTESIDWWDCSAKLIWRLCDLLKRKTFRKTTVENESDVVE
jgi:hypothetical protein